jgi:hypothetical protein
LQTKSGEGKIGSALPHQESDFAFITKQLNGRDNCHAQLNVWMSTQQWLVMTSVAVIVSVYLILVDFSKLSPARDERASATRHGTMLY